MRGDEILERPGTRRPSERDDALVGNPVRDTLERLARDVLDANVRAARNERRIVARDEDAIDVVGARRDERRGGVASDGDVGRCGSATSRLDVYSTGRLG